MRVFISAWNLACIVTNIARANAPCAKKNETVSFPNYVHIPVVGNRPHCVAQLKPGDLIESRLGENAITFLGDEGVKPLRTITTTHGVIVCTAEQEFMDASHSWVRADQVGSTLMYYFGRRYESVPVLTTGLIVDDRVYTIETEKGEYVAAGHVTR